MRVEPWAAVMKETFCRLHLVLNLVQDAVRDEISEVEINSSQLLKMLCRKEPAKYLLNQKGRKKNRYQWS